MNNKKSVCSVCGSYNTSEIYPADINLGKLSFTYTFTPDSRKTFRVMRCHECSHIFCFPLPSNIFKKYEDVIDDVYAQQAQTRILTARKILNLIKNFIPSGKLLDVGCATGDFLQEAKKQGYTVEGLELSKWSAHIARERGIKVHEKTLASLSRKIKKKYEIITMWAVIEHFEKPYKEMLHLQKLLKPGGYLFLWTGDVDSITSKVLGRKWWYWQGQHIQYFSSKSLNKLGALTGFKHITTKVYPLAATHNQVTNSLKRYLLGGIIAFMLKPLFTFKKVWYMHFPGEMLWVGRKK